ncbi:MAG: HAD family hydrolase [Thermoplasmatota archaeon]
MSNLFYELIVFDMDGVLVDISSSWKFVHDHFGVNNDDSLKAYLKGEIDDLEFIKRDIALWKGKKREVDKSYIENILKDVPLMPGYYKCLSTLKEIGYKTAILSGGLKSLAIIIDDNYFDLIWANDLEEEGGRLTGKGILEVPIKEKGRVFDNLTEQMNVDAKKCVAVGNSFIDSEMVKKAELGIAFNPSDASIKKAADFVLEKKDLTEILNYL